MINLLKGKEAACGLRKQMFPYLAILSIMLFLLSVKLHAQAAMDFVNYPVSVSSMGMGQQAVALPKYDGALTYNPANLAFIDKPSLSFYHRQFAFAPTQYPLNSISAFFNIENIGSFGIQYLNHDHGKFALTSSENPEPLGYFDSYDRSISIGFAHRFSPEFTAGISLTYARTKLSQNPNDHILISGGLNYVPDYFSKKVSIGLSLTNFSNAIKFEYDDDILPENYSFDSPPAKLNLGAYYTPLSNDYFTTGLQLAISKYIVDVDSKTGEGKSSFKSLFTDWDDFPEDVSIYTGLAFEWKPLNLGNGFSIFQNYYIGEQSEGIKEYGSSILTHGAELGVGYKDYSLSAAYSGIWHNVQNPYFASGFLGYPIESFQFKFSLNTSIFKNTDKERKDGPALKNIIVSFGAGQSFRVGRYKGTYLGFYSDEQKNSLNYNIESAFYLNENNSLVSTVNYSSIPWVVKSGTYKILDTKIETFTFTSQYRYHPLESFSPFYFQGGLGIIRYNPIINTSPKYEYKTTLHFSIGAVFPVIDNIVIDPEAAYTLMLNTAGDSAPRLGGYNQFDLRIKVGYKL